MINIILASNNPGKVSEVKKILGQVNHKLTVSSLNDMGITEEIEEPGTSFYQNALIKAEYIAKKYPDQIILADDSGLEVDALAGEPGVYSARYAKETPLYKEDKNFANNQKLLSKLSGLTNRKANFKTVLCLIVPGYDPIFVSGSVNGEILSTYQGKNGFGYDPIFSIDGIESFAEMPSTKKNMISHRYNALDKLSKNPIWQVL